MPEFFMIQLSEKLCKLGEYSLKVFPCGYLLAHIGRKTKDAVLTSKMLP